MYGQPLDEFDKLLAADVSQSEAGGGEESRDDRNVSNALRDGCISDFEGVEPDIVSDDSVLALPGVDSGDQLTLSYRGQVYVFDNVTTEKVQRVFLHLGGCEFPVGPQGVEQSYQTPVDMEYPLRYSDPQRAASLNRFRQKRKERCFEKKIRYNVRQEVAIRMQRKKGQFSSSKTCEGSESCNTSEADEPGKDESPAETLCSNCSTSSRSTPMMRRGPNGPRTLCQCMRAILGKQGNPEVNLTLRPPCLVFLSPAVAIQL